METCGGCRASTPRLYRDEEQRWLCERCAPAMVTCSKEGCDFQDFPQKTTKHSLFWCEQCSECRVCEAALQPGSLAQHYLTCREIAVVPVGAGHRISYCPDGSRFRVQDVMCMCVYSEGEFGLWLHSPVVGRQLHRYRCEVRLEGAGRTRIYTPPAVYYTDCDWFVFFQDSQFLADDLIVYVSVTLVD